MSILEEAARVKTNLGNTHDFNKAAKRLDELYKENNNQWQSQNKLLNLNQTTLSTNTNVATYTCASSLTN
jgi:hypothetical protein